MLFTGKPSSIFYKFGDDEYRGENENRDDPSGENEERHYFELMSGERSSRENTTAPNRSTDIRTRL